MDPIILFYLLGLVAGILKSPIRLPRSIYDFLSAYLLIAIGLKGGVELHENSSFDMIPKVILISILGLILPLIAYPILKKLGKFKKEDAASIAAHYGSVSVGTFAVGLAFLQSNAVSFESYVPLFVVILEIPAIIVGIILARGVGKNTNWKELLQEIFLGKSVVLMVIGLLVGWASGPEKMAPLEPLFFDMFKGMLGLFLLEMGHVTSEEIKSLKKYGAFLLGFGVAMPVASGCLGALVGVGLDLSVGGITILAVLAGSASYIAVPAAMRISVPEANPSLSLTASLGVTFPFNILLGIPLYYWIARKLIAIY